MTTSRKKPETEQPNNQALSAKPLTQVQPTKLRSVGRPARLEMPALPKMSMEPIEEDLYNFFMDSFKEQYPDMVPTDHLLLHLAALEYVKYLRIVAEELETGKVISMARQHPGTNMRALLDQLSVTRKARTLRQKPEEDQEAKEFKEMMMSMSMPRKKG